MPSLRSAGFLLRPALLALAALAAGVAAAGAAAAQDASYPRGQHPWGKFQPGSWKLVRVVTETLDANGHVASASITETKTTLVGVDDAGYTLKVEVEVEVAGRKFASPVQTVWHGYWGQSSGQTALIRRLPDSELTVNGQKVVSQVRQSTIAENGSKRVTTFYFSDRAPYLLRREATSGAENDPKPARTTTEVLAGGMPFDVLGDLRAASFVKTVQSGAKGTAVTIEVHCEDVPGAVVAHSSRETDENSKVVRRSTLQLEAFELVEFLPDNGGQKRIYHHSRNRREERRENRR